MFRLRQRTTGFNPNQLEKIVQFMEEHPDLNSGNLYPEKRNDLWVKLIDILNEDKSGSNKTISQWRKCWSDKKLSLRYKVKEKKLLSAIEKRMLPFIGCKVVECKRLSEEELEESNPSDVLITGLSVDYENSPELNEQIKDSKESTELSPKKQNLKNGENSFSDAYAYCSVSYGNESMEKPNLENEENYFTDDHGSSSCKYQSGEKFSVLEMIAAAAEKQALAAEKQALATEKQRAALEILAVQSIQQSETLSEILTIMDKIA